MVVVAKKAARLEKRNKNVWIGTDQFSTRHCLAVIPEVRKPQNLGSICTWLEIFGPRKDNIGWQRGFKKK